MCSTRRGAARRRSNGRSLREDIDAILALKRGATPSSWPTTTRAPEIFHCVADIVGDSLALAREAMTVDADGHRSGRRALHGRDGEDAQSRTRRC